jgi:hypothetical protein
MHRSGGEQAPHVLCVPCTCRTGELLWRDMEEWKTLSSHDAVSFRQSPALQEGGEVHSSLCAHDLVMMISS